LFLTRTHFAARQKLSLSSCAVSSQILMTTKQIRLSFSAIICVPSTTSASVIAVSQHNALEGRYYIHIAASRRPRLTSPKSRRAFFSRQKIDTFLEPVLELSEDEDSRRCAFVSCRVAQRNKRTRHSAHSRLSPYQML